MRLSYYINDLRSVFQDICEEVIIWCGLGIGKYLLLYYLRLNFSKTRPAARNRVLLDGSGTSAGALPAKR